MYPYLSMAYYRSVLLIPWDMHFQAEQWSSYQEHLQYYCYINQI